MKHSDQPNFKLHFSNLLTQAANKLWGDGLTLQIELVRTKQVKFGDYSCNLAMQLAKSLRKNPRAVAAMLIDALPSSPYLEKVEIAGSGFINLFVKNSAKQQFLYAVLNQGNGFGCVSIGSGKKILVEFVSANPTGPLHVGHGRGAAFGASLVNVLTAAGFSVSREYYVNDAGRQMDILALSTWLRYLTLHGYSFPFPENAYQGEYVLEMAQTIEKEHGRRYVRQPDLLLLYLSTDVSSDEESRLNDLIVCAKNILCEDYANFYNIVLTTQLEDCRNDLEEFRVEFDTWFSEQSLFDSGKVAQAITFLDENGMLYQQDGAVWFRSTHFGDEKDRVVKRENGQFTYFASDIAYHLDKFERGFDQVINIWGADHHGYIPRINGAIHAFGIDADKLKIALVQFAVLYRSGKKVPMSTRSGKFVALKDLLREVGTDAARFFYVLRKSEQHLDFDLDLAKSQSNDNPVYYVQYAHARVCSVMAQWGQEETMLSNADAKMLDSPIELALIQKLIDYPDIVESAAREFSPHYVSFYLKELASDFHSYYNATRFLVHELPLRHARLILIASIRQVLRNGLMLLGVSAPEKM